MQLLNQDDRQGGRGTHCPLSRMLVLKNLQLLKGPILGPSLNKMSYLPIFVRVSEMATYRG